jgi:hypothetical protein
MKRNLTKAFSAGALTASLAILPLTLSAQAQTNTTDPGVNTAPTTRTTTYREDNTFDWGWLGLLGLLGLAGLAGKNRRDEPVRYRDPNSTAGSTSYRE